MARRIKDTSFEHISKLVNNDIGLDVHADLELNMANAYIEDVHNAAQHDAVIDELEKKAEGVITEHEEPEAPIKNEYTATLKLDESLEDFKFEGFEDEEYDEEHQTKDRLYLDVDEEIDRIFTFVNDYGLLYDTGKVTLRQYIDFLQDIYNYLSNGEVAKIFDKHNVVTVNEDIKPVVEAREDEDEDDDLPGEDKHLDMDMLDFLSIAFTGVFPKVNNPLSNDPIPTFKIQSNTTGASDIDPEVLAGMSEEEVEEFLAKQNRADRPPMIGGDHKSIDLYANKRERLEEVIKICDEWKLEHSQIIRQNPKTTTYPFRLEIRVPLRDSDNALGVEEYFRTVYPNESDFVMYKLFHSAPPTYFPRTYYSKKFNLMLPDIVEEVRSRAYSDSTKPLTAYLDELYKQLDDLYAPVLYGGRGPYNKKKIKIEFMEPMIQETIQYAIEDAKSENQDPIEALNDLYHQLDSDVGSDAYSKPKIKKQFKDAFKA